MFTDFNHQYQLDLLRGNRVAVEFKKLIVTQMPNVRIREPTQDQDVKDHIDIFINDVGYEIKGQKTNPDHPEFFVEDCFTIEYKNNAGYNGWIFGKAFYIAQEFNFVFLCYKRQQLLDWFLLNIDKYKPYTKPMNKSVVYYLPLKDCIHQISSFTIFKSNFLQSIQLKPNNKLNFKPMNSTPFVQKPNTIIMHTNKKKTQDKHPDFRGTIAVEIDGVTHYREFALWSKIAASGGSYHSGLINLSTDKDNGPETAKIVPTHIVNSAVSNPTQKGGGFVNDEKDGDLPF